MTATKPITGIKSVGFYRDSQGTTCDRCGAFIKNVVPVHFKDGAIQRYGTECIERILGGDTSLQALWNRNLKLMRKYQGFLEIFSRPVDQLPRGHEYYGTGIMTVTDDAGNIIWCPSAIGGSQHCYFHPAVDVEKNRNLTDRQPIPDIPAFQAKCLRDIDGAKGWLAAEIARIEAFLARVLSKGLVNGSLTN